MGATFYTGLVGPKDAGSRKPTGNGGGGGCKSGGSEKLGCLFVLKKEEKKDN